MEPPVRQPLRLPVHDVLREVRHHQDDGPLRVHEDLSGPVPPLLPDPPEGSQVVEGTPKDDEESDLCDLHLLPEKVTLVVGSSTTL